MATLTPKQERFAREYMIDLNGTEAARRAGYSESSARRIASNVLALPAMQQRISELMADRAAELELTSNRVLAEIMVLALYDPADYVSVGSPADIASLPELARRAIIGWGYDRNGRFIFKLADKARALDMLMRHLGLYNDKLELGGLDALGDRLARAKARLLEKQS